MSKDTRKIIQALTYLANYQPDKMLDNMKAYKLLWLADRYHLRQTGRTITGDAYYAMPFGIVPSDAKCLLENAKTKLKDPKGYKNKYLILDGHQYKAIADPDMKEFSQSDREALDKVLAAYNRYDALHLSSISHKFPEWTFYQDMLENKDAKNSYKIDLDHFFEDAPEGERQLFDDSSELLELTRDLYHQYNRVQQKWIFPQNQHTYINCNNIIEISEYEFGKLIREGKVHRLDGQIDELGMQLIANGVKLSPEVEERIKDLFE